MTLKIGKVYKTSKGIFFGYADANRNRGFVPETMREPARHEPVEEIFVLVDDENNQCYYLGPPLQIK